jgi:hypothetical protein
MRAVDASRDGCARATALCGQLERSRGPAPEVALSDHDTVVPPDVVRVVTWKKKLGSMNPAG